jgi:hypothetical protein
MVARAPELGPVGRYVRAHWQAEVLRRVQCVGSACSASVGSDRSRPSLGNAALRVMRELVDDIVGTDPGPRLRVAGYGTRSVVRVDGRNIAWYPLAHPAAPQAYQDTHQRFTPA